MRPTPGTLAAVIANATSFGPASTSPSIAPTSTQSKKTRPSTALVSTRPRARGSIAPAPIPSAESLLASQFDLRGSVQLAEALRKKAEIAPAPGGSLELAIATVDGIARDVEGVRLATSQRARALSVATVLGTLRGAGALDDVTGNGIGRATRSIWAPFASWLDAQAATAERAIDAAKADAIGSLRARSARDSRLAQLDAILDDALGAARARANDETSQAIEKRLGIEISAIVAPLGEDATEGDVAPILASEGPLAMAFALGEAQLRARIRHHARATAALLRGAVAEDSV